MDELDQSVKIQIKHQYAKYLYAESCARLASTILLRMAQNFIVNKDEIEIARDLMDMFKQYSSIGEE